MILLFPIYKDVWEVKKPSNEMINVYWTQTKRRRDCLCHATWQMLGGCPAADYTVQSFSIFQHTWRKKKNKESVKHAGMQAGTHANHAKWYPLPCQFCAGVCAVLRDSICAFNDHIKIQENRELWIV